MPPKKTTAAKRKSAGGAAASPAKKGKAPKAEPEESEEEASSDEEEEEEVPVKSKKATPAKKDAGKKAAKKEESEGSDEEEDEEEEESEEEAAPQNGKKAAAEEVDDDEEEGDDDEEEGDDDEEEEDDEDEGSGDSKKRKKSQADKSAKKAKSEVVTSLFVGNIGDLDTSKIESFFKKHEIVLADVRRRNNAGICFVDLENADDLEKALELDGEKIGKVEIQVQKARPKHGDAPAEKSDDEKARDTCTLFVKNLPFTVTDEDLKDVFKNVQEIRTPKNYEGQNKGFAFIQFETAKEVEDAIAEHQGIEFQGRSLFLDKVGQGPKKGDKRRDSRPEAGKTKVLFVKNLSYDVTTEQLKEHFDGCDSARIATDRETGNSRGFGFVEFKDAETCKKAFDDMSGSEIDGRAITLDFASEKNDGGRGGGGRFGGRGGFRGGRGGRGFGGRGRGGDRGGRGRGGFRGRGGRGGFGGGRRYDN